MSDFVVVSTAVTDDIKLANGKTIGRHLGGAGIYALSGIRLWTESVVLVTGVGEEFERDYGGWFLNNACKMDGLFVKDKHTAVSCVTYLEDGEREETPLYGSEHYLRLEATPEEFESFVKDAKGVYIFKDTNAAYWQKTLALKKKYGFCLEWEINASAATRENCEMVQKIASQCDIFSLNKREAFALLDVDQLDQAIEILSKWPVPAIYLRVGRDGAIVISNNQVLQIPSVRGITAVDPTGAGNSSTSGFLYGWCRNESPTLCGIRGSVSAAHCITQYGPPSFTEELSHRAAAEAAAMQQEV